MTPSKDTPIQNIGAYALHAAEVLVLGAASWNRIVQVPKLPQGTSATLFEAREYETVGSTGVGKSMALSALGHAPVLHCALGIDHYAENIAEACRARGIALIIDPQNAPTPHHLNIMDTAGGRYSLFLSNGADDPEIDCDRLLPIISAARTIFLSLALSSLKALPLLQETTADIWLDLHDYDGQNPWYDDFIAHGDVIQLSDVALEQPEAVVSRLLTGRARMVVLTKAEKGAEIYTEGENLTIPPCPARFCDSNGAGDAFSVGLWHGLQTGMPLRDAGAFAAATAACAVESLALFPAQTTVEDIAARVAQNRTNAP